MSETATVNKYDRKLGMVTGLPHSFLTKPQTIQIVSPLGAQGTETFIVQTHRQDHRTEEGALVSVEHTLFLQVADETGLTRIILPSKVCDLILRQRDAVSKMLERQNAREASARMKGHRPAGFVRKVG